MPTDKAKLLKRQVWLDEVINKEFNNGYKPPVAIQLWEISSRIRPKKISQLDREERIVRKEIFPKFNIDGTNVEITRILLGYKEPIPYEQFIMEQGYVYLRGYHKKFSRAYKKHMEEKFPKGRLYKEKALSNLANRLLSELGKNYGGGIATYSACYNGEESCEVDVLAIANKTVLEQLLQKLQDFEIFPYRKTQGQRNLFKP